MIWSTSETFKMQSILVHKNTPKATVTTAPAKNWHTGHKHGLTLTETGTERDRQVILAESVHVERVTIVFFKHLGFM